jgi:hypothetical protein
MLQCLFRVSVVFMVVGQVAFLHAQIINAPAAGAVQQAGGAVASASAVEQTAGWGLPMPKLTMPQITMPKLSMPQMALPSMASVTGPFKASFGKVTAGSRKAWEGTREIFSFGKNKTAMRGRASGQQQPSFLQRLLTPKPQEPQVAQTVGEFMRQPRLDP